MITATENSGSPIIGRIASRSTTRPTAAAKARATATFRNQRTQSGPPRLLTGLEMLVNGMWPSVTRKHTNSAPVAARAPWAKLTVWVALKISTKPNAISAYTEPRPIDFMKVWKNRAGSLASCTAPKIRAAPSTPAKKPIGAPRRGSMD